MMNEEIKEAIITLMKKYPEKRSALIPALHLAQRQHGYLPKDIQEDVAELFEIQPNEVNSVVTFYEMFFEKPTGKHLIHVCKNLSCMLRGCDQILDSLCNKLNIEPGRMTEDGEITVIAAECLGACDRAPVWIADDETIGPVHEEDIDTILKKLKEGKGHPSPMDEIEEIRNV